MSAGQVIYQVTTSLIAVLVIVGTFGLVAYQVTHGQSVQIPDVVALLVGGVAGSYLTNHAAQTAANAATNAAAQAAGIAAAGAVGRRIGDTGASGTP